MKLKRPIYAFTVGIFVAALSSTPAQDVAVDQQDVKVGEKEYSPYLYQAYPNRVF